MIGPTLPGAVGAREADDSDSEMYTETGKEGSQLGLVTSSAWFSLI